MLSTIRYCEVLDAEVEVLEFDRLSRGPFPDGPDMICLDVEQRCTRTICPVCTVSPQAILVELSRLRGAH